ncbi:MAG: hypothetical protein U0166_09435 [Acidobacteriota bacterium]
MLFGLAVLGIIGAIVWSKPPDVHEGAPAKRAYGPHDFPQVFGTDEALQGLAPATPGGTSGALFQVPPPPFSDGIYPCSDCHDGTMKLDARRRKLEAEHDDIELHHDEEHRWCLDCHDLKDRDQLRLASGELVPFTESHRLCGQCHGPQYRDWKNGIHGKRTGYWNGTKRYLLCVHCHSPHDPHFKPLAPLPPPVRPQYLGAASDGSKDHPHGRPS